MNRSPKQSGLLAAAIAALSVVSATADTVTNTFTFNVGQAIPDHNANGLTSVGTINFAAFPSVQEVRVGLNISGNFNGDLYAYLQKDGGQAILLNRVGVGSFNPFGYSDAGFNVTLADSAAADIHGYRSSPNPLTSQLTGMWQPDGRTLSPDSAPSLFDDAARPAMLSSFIDTDIAGDWNLFICDASAGGTSFLNSWSLQFVNTVTPVPEPGTVALLGLGAAAVVIGARSRRR